MSEYTSIFGLLIFVGLAIAALYGIISTTTSSSTTEPMRAERQGASATNPKDNGIRQCMNTETKCPGHMKCIGANGKVSGSAAIDPKGNQCCTYKCENDPVPVRECKASETMCMTGQACRMENNIVPPLAVSVYGASCCEYGCDDIKYPVRACFSDENVCATGSYCYDFNGDIVVPTAIASGGGVCCNHIGEGNPVCVSIDGKPL